MARQINWAPFSPKALDAISNCDAFINILEGAVRSAKTVASTIAWLDLVEQSPHREFLMTGHTTDTLYRNVIGSDVGILNILGPRRAKYRSTGEGGAQLILRLGGQEKICYCVGCPNVAAETRIRGMTVGGWYADEVTLYPENVVVQALNRMSLPGARAIWTTNPDSPYHHIKRDYIDQAAVKGYRHWHFELDDNLALDDTFKANLKRSYSGLWYKRFIQGLWVAAEGAIYDMFDPAVHVVDDLPVMQQHWVGIDYGTTNATVFLLLGLGTDNRLYVVREWRWDSVTKGRQMTDAQYSRALRDWLATLSVQPRWIFVDPSAASFIRQLHQDRVRGITHADNAVLDGIRTVSSLLASEKIFFHKSAEGLIEEISGYSWDPKAQKLGEDKPLKQADHGPDSLRYVVNGIPQIVKRLLTA